MPESQADPIANPNVVNRSGPMFYECINRIGRAACILDWTQMTRKAFYWATALVLLAGGIFLRGTASQQGSPAPATVTLLLTLGQKAAKVESWEGTAKVAGGPLVSTEGRHFSAGDSVTGPGAWKCVTRRDEVASFA